MEILFYVIPAALFYAWVIGLGWLAIKPAQPGSSRIAWSILAAVPLAWYLSGFVTGQLDYARHRAHIAELAGVARPKDPPRTLVVWGKREPWQEQLVELGAFDAIYVSNHKTGYRERGPWIRIAYLRSPRCLNAHTKGTDAIALRRAQAAFVACAVTDEVPTAPAEGLTFNIGERWHLSRREMWESSLTPYELYRTRAGQEDELVGYWEQANGGLPMVPPVLTLFGFTQMELADRQNRKPTPEAFLLDRLSLDAATLRPHEEPSEAERREQFVRLARSADIRDREIALRIATVTGDTFLAGEDVDDLLTQPDVMSALVSRARDLSFCSDTGRLCRFADRIGAACRASDAGATQCDRLVEACRACPGAR
ncbi:MAG: hypothetical protein JO328_15150 [Hyphomicrobiales bacterium]|nr:hypothetical protein [Hyphomicrobiales bacterium]MBV8827398.1 hypothetical protein [Hyphomicrobiales bacterium]